MNNNSKLVKVKSTPEPPKNTIKKIDKRKTFEWVKKNRIHISSVLFIIMFLITILLAKGIITAGSTALTNSYNSAFTSERDQAYQTQYEKYYDRAEELYHVSNHVSITVGDLRETAELEVLKVRDVEYIIDDSSSNSNNITSWLEVPGQGTYVVNLQAAEFIVDDERSYILVRVPYPELTNISIDYANVQKLFFPKQINHD